MRKITYIEPIPRYDPITHVYIDSAQETFSIIVANDEEYIAQMKILNNPARGIIIVSVEDIPPEIDPADQLRADVDYIAIMTGVDLNV